MQDKKISIFIDKQLSRYVRTNFQKYVNFIKAYYEFLESNYGPYQVTQTLEHSRDITAKYTSGVIKLKLKFPSAEDETYFYTNYADSKDEIVQSNVNGVVIAKGYVVSYEKTDNVTANLNIVVTSGLFTQAVGNQLNFTDATVTQILHVNSGSLLTENPNLNRLIDELSPDYPQTLIASKQLTIKGLADFLKTKGTEDSFRYFFRSVYNSDLEFYYPKKDMLKVSDGKWNLYSYVTIKRNSTVSYLNKRIVGNTSGAVAAISRVKTVEYNISGTQTQFYQLYVEDLSENFLYNETISYYDNLDLVTTTDVVVSVAGSPSLLRKGVLNSGSSIYTIGDEITIDNTYVDIPSGKTLTELLVRITDLDTEGKLKGFDFVDHGILNYTQTTSTGTFKAYIPPSVSFGSSGAVQEVIINDGGLYPAGSVVTATISAPPSGTTTIVTVQTSTDPSTSKVVVTGITVTTAGNGYKKTPTITFSSTIAAEREASATVFLNLAQIQFTPKTLANEPGQFANTDGFVSWDKYVQNDYYQDFSYVLKSEEDYSDYKNIIKDLLNPAGMVFFGIISLFNSFSLNKYGSPQEYPEFFYPLKVLSFDVKSFLLNNIDVPNTYRKVRIENSKKVYGNTFEWINNDRFNIPGYQGWENLQLVESFTPVTYYYPNKYTGTINSNYYEDDLYTLSNTPMKIVESVMINQFIKPNGLAERTNFNREAFITIKPI